MMFDKKSKLVLPRRTLLRGALSGLGSVALGLPVLDAMLNDSGTALAQSGAPLPKRFGTWFFGGGVVKSEQFFPAATGTNFELTPMLSPLADVKEYLTLVRGPSMAKDVNPGGHWHHRGYALSNTYVTTSAEGYPGDPTEPSIDQIAAAHWKGQTRFDSVELGVLPNGGVAPSSSWKAGHQQLRPEADPKKLFMRLFEGDVPSELANFEAIRAARQSVLDASVESATRLSARLGAADKQRLEAHLEGIRTLERRLQTAATACMRPTAPTIGSTGGKPEGDFAGINAALTDVLVAALACDLTRVFSYMFSGAQDNTVFKQLGINEEYHAMTHDGPWYYANGPKVVTFIMQQLATLANKLKAATEGDGTLLDRTLIYATSEFQDASRHSGDDHPFILLGKAGGSMSGGRNIATPKGNIGAAPSVGAVMMSSLLAVDVPVTHIGDQKNNPESYVTEPLAGLLG